MTTATKRVKDIRKEGETALKSVSKAAEKELQDAGKATRRQARKVARHAGRMEHKAVGYIKDKPYAALGIAAGVGVIAGALLARR
ncbi:MAG: DUF883 family protein [Oceanicaulis sp.]|uniref:glycine zipper domain-containing protein n=1 Tax=Glycocaulis sp. TaxID=1969725 RepID=UPI0025BAD726|nr:hypothetical protein [Glycocaulis sp.]MCC5982444.1 DUF883 family protein [Oceanicaulis sp.]MCH8520450.1 hypothetical protein [Glycocaulis sp.]